MTVAFAGRGGGGTVAGERLRAGPASADESLVRQVHHDKCCRAARSTPRCAWARLGLPHEAPHTGGLSRDRVTSRGSGGRKPKVPRSRSETGPRTVPLPVTGAVMASGTQAQKPSYLCFFLFCSLIPLGRQALSSAPRCRSRLPFRGPATSNHHHHLPPASPLLVRTRMPTEPPKPDVIISSLPVETTLPSLKAHNSSDPRWTCEALQSTAPVHARANQFLS